MDPAGDDWAVIRLGLPGIVHRVVVDTAFFDGNHPLSAEVDIRWIEGHPTPAEVVDGPWEPLCGTALQGDTAHTVEVEHPRAATHVRLRIHPDGGVARLRVLGEVLPDVRRWRGIGVDLASLAAGGRVLDASNRHYSPPENLLLPGTAADMGQGWETRRRREGGFDWVDVALGVAGRVHQVVVDTTHFVGNAPGTVRLVALGGLDGERRAAARDRGAARHRALVRRSRTGSTTASSSTASGSRSVPTAGSRGCGCTAARPARPPPRRGCGASTRCPRRSPRRCCSGAARRRNGRRRSPRADPTTTSTRSSAPPPTASARSTRRS